MDNREVCSIGELAVESAAARRVFERIGVDYCCSGSRPLGVACASIGITVKEILGLIEHDARFAPDRGADRDWSRESLRELILHIMDAHHSFVRAEMLRLPMLIRKVSDAQADRHPELISIDAIFRSLQQELAPHMMKEEQILFPFVALLEEASASRRPVPLPPFATVENPIRAMVAEHEAVNELLNELRAITHDYAMPRDPSPSYIAMLDGLRHFESDLHLHMHLENNLLFPRAVRLEDEAVAGLKYQSCES